MYLSVYLARGGVCARRKAAELVKEGQISVNGDVILDPAYLVQPHDKIVYMERRVQLEAPMYVMLNKPRGVVSSCADEKRRKTVVDMIELRINRRPVRLYPVGRLDKETTGLLVLTNDGTIAQKMAHPKYEIKKTYMATLDKELTHEAYEALKKGFFLYDGRFVPDKVYYPRKHNKFVVGLVVHSGKYRVIRRAFYKLGYEVNSLDRIGYGPLSLRGLARGAWRLLSADEIKDFMGEK
ncbi:MAG: rRNA synthase [Candidatus Dependentiae bacterium]|nr:rRNA synthase [Candidatus Dependentiae bacterium]